jgi:hypothetical protein
MSRNRQVTARRRIGFSRADGVALLDDLAGDIFVRLVRSYQRRLARVPALACRPARMPGGVRLTALTGRRADVILRRG